MSPATIDKTTVAASGPGTGLARRRRLIGADSDTIQLMIGVAVVFLAMIAPELMDSIYWRQSFQIIGILVTVSIFLNFLYMDAGQISFGQGAILGASAYATAVFYGTMGTSFFLAAAGGMAAALIFGLAFALPALRVQDLLSRIRHIWRGDGLSRADRRVR